VDVNINRASTVLCGSHVGFLLGSAILGSPVAATAQFHPYRMALGVRFEYVSLGGDQFATLTDGVGVDGFLRVPLDRHCALEVGAAATGHRQNLVCVFGRPCIPTTESVIASVYVAPAVRRPVPGTGVVAYSAVRAGVLFGDFQDDGPGFEVGVGAGGVIPVFRNLTADVSVFGGLVHVGTSLPRSGFGRRLVLRVGLGYALQGPSSSVVMKESRLCWSMPE